MKTVIVTGGSRGIGKCIAENQAKEGYNVVLNYNKSVKEAKKTKEELEKQGIKIEIYKADVSKREEVTKLIKFTLGKFGNIDVLINNAGIAKLQMSSIWGMIGASCEVAYSVSKAGINGMTKALAKELGPSNIRVNAIAPGVIDTDMNSNIDEAIKEEIKNETPLNKIGKPIDIYRCVKWLIEDEFTTGQIISPNGGYVI